MALIFALSQARMATLYNDETTENQSCRRRKLDQQQVRLLVYLQSEILTTENAQLAFMKFIHSIFGTCNFPIFSVQFPKALSWMLVIKCVTFIEDVILFVQHSLRGYIF